MSGDVSKVKTQPWEEVEDPFDVLVEAQDAIVSAHGFVPIGLSQPEWAILHKALTPAEHKALGALAQKALGIKPDPTE